MSEFPPVAELVPHSGPMVLLDRLVTWSPGQAECVARLRADARLVEGDALAVPLSIEHMAQSVAVCLGYEAFLNGQGERVGMVVSCRNFKAYEDSIPVGSELSIHVERIRGNETTSHFDCEVSVDNRCVASATLTLFYGDLPAG